MSIPRSCSGHLYEVLQVEPTASIDEIRRNYKKLALRFHPDRNNGTTSEQFQEIEEAHRILSDSEKRSLYDLLGREAMKQIGDSPVFETMLANPKGLLVMLCTLIFIIGSFFIGLCLFFWRYDKQYLLANQSHPTKVSWWWCTLPLWPLSLVAFLGGVIGLRVTLREQGFAQSCMYLIAAFLPFGLWTAIAVLNGTLSPGIGVIVLLLGCMTSWVGEWSVLQEYVQVEASSESVAMTNRFARKCVLYTVFFGLLLLRCMGMPLSAWIVSLPLIVRCVLVLKHNVTQACIWLYIVLFWTQKLNVEFGGRGKYDPHAITASLPIFVLSLVLFLATIASYVHLFIFKNERRQANNEAEPDVFEV